MRYHDRACVCMCFYAYVFHLRPKAAQENLNQLQQQLSSAAPEPIPDAVPGCVLWGVETCMCML